jgi:pyrimidine-nucleoside phosphorylase
VAASIVDLIARKRDGGELAPKDMQRVVAPEVPDYQLAAFLMAVVWRGLSPDETRGLLDAMVASGARIDLSSLGRPVADKHSTGGVGDKTTLVVAPIVAACGIPVAKLSGRGLGHTGGTLDKLESIPGYRVELSVRELVAQLHDVGIVVAGQTEELAPADRRLYALRDATATVPSIPLIATSIMAKKIAGGASRLVLDVKVGEGALFMSDLSSARALAHEMRRLGAGPGIETACLLSTMERPLGRAVGNALEVAEAVETLSGVGPPDLEELAIESAGLLVGGRERARQALASGAAREAFERWIRAQGGDPDGALPRAPVVAEVPAPRSGVVAACHARALGEAAMRLGAGRAEKGASIDHAVGVVVRRTVGEEVERGEPLATVHARGATDLAAIAACFEIRDEAPAPGPVVLETIAGG